MLLQETPYTCGPTAICNAVAALGEQLNQAHVAEVAKACPIRGTSVRRLTTALKKLGRQTVQLQPEKRPKGPDVATRAWAGLLAALRTGAPVILSVDDDEHWVAAIGLIGRERVLVADSADGALVLCYSRQELLNRWKGRSWKRPYFGVIVT